MRNFLLLLFLLCLAAGPSTGPTTKPVEIFAFRGGGGLTGEAEPLRPRVRPAPDPQGAKFKLSLRWTYVADDKQHPIIDSAATIAGDTVYVSDDRGTLHAIDLATGKGKWKYVSDGGFDTSPLIMDGRIYLGDLSGLFHCVSAVDGKKIWTFDSGGIIHASANSDGTHIVFGNDNAQIYCLDTAGTKLWTAAAGDRINAAPSIGSLPDGRKIALFSGCDSQLRAIELAAGKEVFTADLVALAPGSPAMLKDRIVVGTDQGHVLCFSAEGKPLWDFSKVEDNAMVFGSPAVSAGIVVVGARDRMVHAISLADGAPLWNFTTGGDVDSSPLISDGRVYFGSKDKKLYALDLKTGEKLWVFTAARGISAPPAIGRGVLVIGDERGNVYCFEP